MLNKDINTRFEDWLLNPNEALDFEVKCWLDMDEAESVGVVAKALIALENHGGGFLLFGFIKDQSGKLVSDANRPDSFEAYSTDALNAIVKKRAEPAFHVQTTIQVQPVSKLEYPLVRVSGLSKVPVRSDSESGKSLKNYTYYIRAAGPESRSPLNAAEWETLIRRAILNQRDEIISVLRTFGMGAQQVVAPSPDGDLKAFAASSRARWSILNTNLGAQHPAFVERGFFEFSARLVGTSKNLSAKQILNAIESARRYTGWPIFVALHQEATRPKLVDGCLQAWLGPSNIPDVGHADFWRVCPDGNFYLVRGFQEDSLEPDRNLGKPGEQLEVTLPVWRVGEFLLRVNELSSVMFEEGFQIHVQCTWEGLRGRALFVYRSNHFMLDGTYKCAQQSVTTRVATSQTAIRDLLPETVKALVRPLYEYFDLFQPDEGFYARELARLKGGIR